MKPLLTLTALLVLANHLCAQQLTAYAGPDTLICIAGESDSVDVEFGAINTATGGTPPYIYRWYTTPSNGRITSDFILDTTAQDPTLIFIELDQFPREFYVEVIDDSGNTALDSVIIGSCGNNPVPLGCNGIYAEVGDTITLNMVSGFTCIDSIEWFPKDNIISSDTGTSIQVLVSDLNFNYNGYYAELKSESGCDAQSSHTCPFVAGIYPQGFGEINSEPVQVFPNPSSGKFTVLAPAKIRGIEIYNTLGESVFYIHGIGNEMNIDATLASGIYLLNVSTASGIQHQRMVID